MDELRERIARHLRLAVHDVLACRAYPGEVVAVVRDGRKLRLDPDAFRRAMGGAVPPGQAYWVGEAAPAVDYAPEGYVRAIVDGEAYTLATLTVHAADLPAGDPVPDVAPKPARRARKKGAN